MNLPTRCPATLVAAVLVAAPVHGQVPQTEHTLRADATDRPAASLADVAWLEGHWRGEGLGAVVEETWLPPAGGAMAGVFRLVDDGELRFYELVTLTEEAGSLVLRLKHFNADLTGWEAADETVDFPLVRMRLDTLWFDGLTIAREGETAMRIWVALEQSSGEVGEGEFIYRRVGTAP